MEGRKKRTCDKRNVLQEMIIKQSPWVLLAPQLLLKLGATIFQGRLILKELRYAILDQFQSCIWIQQYEKIRMIDKVTGFLGVVVSTSRQLTEDTRFESPSRHFLFFLHISFLPKRPDIQTLLAGKLTLYCLYCLIMTSVKIFQVGQA